MNFSPFWRVFREFPRKLISSWFPYRFWHFYSVGVPANASTIVGIPAVEGGLAVILAVACCWHQFCCLFHVCCFRPCCCHGDTAVAPLFLILPEIIFCADQTHNRRFREFFFRGGQEFFEVLLTCFELSWAQRRAILGSKKSRLPRKNRPCAV